MPQPGIYFAFGDPLVLGVKTYPELVGIYGSVEDSINDILTTQIGTRRMRPTYGINIYSYIFETSDAFLEAQIDQEVRRALELNEPRIQVRNVAAVRQQDVRREYSIIQITVGYNIRGQYLETAITQQVQGG
jgi:phage baseplate assembly protein W